MLLFINSSSNSEIMSICTKLIAEATAAIDIASSSIGVAKLLKLPIMLLKLFKFMIIIHENHFPTYNLYTWPNVF